MFYVVIQAEIQLLEVSLLLKKKIKTDRDSVQRGPAVTEDETSLGPGYSCVVLKVLLIPNHSEAKNWPLEKRRQGDGEEVFLPFLLFSLSRHPLARSGSGRHAALPPGRTFLSGEVGVVTWFVGLVGGDTVMLVEVAVTLLLTDAEGLLLSAGETALQIKNHHPKKNPAHIHSLAWLARAALAPASVSDSESSSSSSSLEQLDSSFFPSSSSSTFSGSKVSMRGALFSGSSSSVSLLSDKIRLRQLGGK